MTLRATTTALLTAVLATVAMTACPAPEATSTWHSDIAPLFQNECMSCHQEGGIGPFPLTTYDEVVARKDLVGFSVSTRRMPPSNFDNSGDCQHYPDARWLDDDEIARVVAWVESGAPEGTAPATPLTPPVLPGLSGDGIIDVVMAEPYTPVPTAQEPNDNYRCFILDPQRTTDGWLTGYEIVPGVPAEVHHMLLFSLLSDEAETDAQALDDTDAEPGFECFGDAGVDDTNLLAVWAPGRDAVEYPEGTGLFVAGGHKLVMQVHYNLLSGAEPDQTALRLRFTDQVQKDALLVPIADDDLTLEGGLPQTEYSFTQPLLGLPEPIEIHGTFPHMHTLGRTLTFTRQPIVDGDSSKECLTRVPNWNFHWQELAFYEEPILVDGSERLDITCTFDTTGREGQVFWGEGTQDEMCLVFVYLTRETGEPVAEIIE